MRRAVGLALIALAACGPPGTFEVSTNEYAVDIILGAGATPRPRGAVRSDPVPLGFPGFIQPLPPRPHPGVPEPGASPGACPKADPFGAALLPAGADAPSPPRVASYVFADDGFVDVEGAARVALPPVSRRAVVAVREGDGGDYTYDVEADASGPVTATTYEVLNHDDAPDRGLYLARVRTGDAVFAPDPAVLLMPFPQPDFGTNLGDETSIVLGRTYRSAGSDPTTGYTLAVEAHVDGKERVDACGSWVDAWKIVVTSGRIVGPGKDLTFTGSFNVATQYGALVVADDVDMSGTDGMDTLHSVNRAHITRVPDAP